MSFNMSLNFSLVSGGFSLDESASSGFSSTVLIFSRFGSRTLISITKPITRPGIPAIIKDLFTEKAH